MPESKNASPVTGGLELGVFNFLNRFVVSPFFRIVFFLMIVLVAIQIYVSDRSEQDAVSTPVAETVAISEKRPSEKHHRQKTSAMNLQPDSSFSKVSFNENKENGLAASTKIQGIVVPAGYSTITGSSSKNTYQDYRAKPTDAQAYEGREAAVLAARSAGQALRSMRQGSGGTKVSTGKQAASDAFYRELQSSGQQFVATAGEEMVALQALRSSGEAKAADSKTAERNVKAATANAVVSSSLAAAHASKSAPLAHLELEILPSDETGWGFSASTILPLWESQEKNHTAFSQLSFRKDAEEFVSPDGGQSLITDTVASAGFAYRNYQETRGYLWGLNTFFDTDVDEHWRSSLGVDFDWGVFSLSSNYYKALTSWQSTVDGFEAKIRDGYDLEARGRVKPLDGAEIGLKAFNWLGDDGADDISGLEVSAHYRPISLIGFNGSYGFNNGDLPLWEAGVSFVYLLGVSLEQQTRHLTYAEKVDLKNLRHRKVRRENRLFLQERVKASNSVSVASLKGTMMVDNARGLSAVNQGDRFAFPAMLSLSAVAGDVANMSFHDGAVLSLGSGTRADVTSNNVVLQGDGFVRYKSGSVSRTLTMPGGISIRLIGTEVELRQQAGESTVGVLSGTIVVSGPGYSVSAKQADIIDVRSGKKLFSFADRFRHINASLAMIDGPSLRSSAWSGDDLDGNGLTYETDHQLEQTGDSDAKVELRLSFSGSHLVDLGTDGVTYFFRTAENQQSTVIVEVGLFADGIPVSLVDDVAVTLFYSGSASASDLQSRPATITIPAGQKSQRLTLRIADDTKIEDLEELQIKAIATSPQIKIRNQQMRLSIFDNDNPFSTPTVEGCACGSPNSVDAGSAVALDASGSHARAGRSIVSYYWQQVGGARVVLSGANSVQPHFTAPNVSVETTLRFKLSVTDDFGVESAKVIEVKVIPAH